LPRGKLSAGAQIEVAATKRLHVSVGYKGWLNTGAGSENSVEVGMRYSF
jgi:hypothetical protein